MTSPIGSGLTLNARLATGLLLGSSTEAAVASGATTVDLLLAFPATAVTVSNSTFNGTYQCATLDFPGASPSAVRSTMFTATADGKGSLGNFTVNGHAANLAAGALQSQPFAGSYAVNGDGTGGFNLTPTTGVAPALLSGPRNLYISSDGNYVMGATTTAGGHDVLFGVRSAASSSNGTFLGLYFSAGMALGASGLSDFAGSANSGGAGSVLSYRRLHYSSTTAGSLDFTSAATYALGADGTGTSQLLHMAAGGQAAFFVGTGDLDPSNYELDVAALVPSAAVLGKVVLSPAGVVNAASLAPVGNPVAPGEYVSLFGVGLAAAPAGAVSLPLPKVLGGASVTVNGIPAALNYVSPNQINALVPFGVTGSKATFVVTNGSASNSVDVPLAATAPGIFSQTSSGSGAAVVLKADYSLVTPANAPRRGDALQIYLTGLGAVNPKINDGQAAPASPLSVVTAQVTVLIGGQAATVLFQGLAPGFAGLYQVNVTIPANAPLGDHVPLSISTTEAFHDQVDIPVH
jgi:uncharacterized protein (TIGR03437 family)